MTAQDTHNRLTLTRIAIDTYRENVAYLNCKCEVYRAEGFQSMSKIEVSSDGRSILAVLVIVRDSRILAPGELGLSEQAFSQLGVEEGTQVRIRHAPPPVSIEAVRRKIRGERLSAEDFHTITGDIVKNRYSKMEMAAFLVASSVTGLDRDEVLSYTRAMADTGDRLNWKEPLVADKHCIGGIPGNRTTMLVVPIVAAHGMLIPKTSSRAITSPAGTADTMEVLAEVSLSPRKLHSIVQKHRGCLAWGGTARLAPVDESSSPWSGPLALMSWDRWWPRYCPRNSRPVPLTCLWISLLDPVPRCAR
jgi:thymidine phosphorylase